MLERHRGRPFAAGLALGLVLAFAIFAVLDLIAEPDEQQGQQIGHASISSYADSEEGDKENNPLPIWALRLLSVEESIAQWVMAVFTAIAAGLLWGTLRRATEANESAISAAKAANKANEIMRAEQRPWVTVLWEVPCEFKEFEDGKFCSIRLKFDFENKGKTPAFGVRHEWGVFRFDMMKSGAGVAGREEMLSKALRSMTMPSRTPILFQGGRTHNAWGQGSNKLGVGGEETGDIFLCACLVYALDDKWTEIAMEGRVYKLVPGDDLPEGRTHEILRIPEYDRIETWKQ